MNGASPTVSRNAILLLHGLKAFRKKAENPKMPVGTVGFVKERLTEARQARGLTKIALAEMVDVTPAAISQYENGPQTPRPEVMDKICEKLGSHTSFYAVRLTPKMTIRSFGDRMLPQRKPPESEVCSAFGG